MRMRAAKQREVHNLDLDEFSYDTLIQAFVNRPSGRKESPGECRGFFVFAAGRLLYVSINANVPEISS